jgi:hypothetical protein
VETVLQTTALTVEPGQVETVLRQAVQAQAAVAGDVIDGSEAGAFLPVVLSTDATPGDVIDLMQEIALALTQQAVQGGILETVLLIAEETAEPLTQHSAQPSLEEAVHLGMQET